MKEILISVILLLDLYSLYTNPSTPNIIIFIISLLLLFAYHKTNTKEHFLFDPNEKPTKPETGTVSITTTGISEPNSDIYFLDKSYREQLFSSPEHRALRDKLVYYVSTFDSTYVDIEKSQLKNHINNNVFKPLSFRSQLSSESEAKFQQNNGIRVIKKLEAPSARNLLQSFDDFSVFWYMKLDFPEQWFYFSDKNNSTIETEKVYRRCYSGEDQFEKSSDEKNQKGVKDRCYNKEKYSTSKRNNKHDYSFFVFDHENIETKKGNYKLLEIRFVFIPGDYNPKIQLKFVDIEKSGGVLTYTYKPPDFFSKRIMTDNQFHLFTFIKWGSKVFFYLDDVALIDCSSAGGCFNPEEYTLYSGDGDIKIRDAPMRMNDNKYIDNRHEGLKFNLNAFGVYRNKIFDEQNTPQSFVTSLTNYFKNVKDYMTSYKKFGIDNEARELRSELANAQNKLKTLEHQMCPFTNSSICNALECQYINNWTNLGHLANTPLCFEKVMQYCNDDKNVNKEEYCAFLNSRNIGMLARNLKDNPKFREGLGENNLIGVGEAGCRNDGSKLEIKEINLDPSFRKKISDLENLNNNVDAIRIINDNVNTKFDLDAVDKIDTDKYNSLNSEFENQEKKNSSTNIFGF